MSKPHYFSFYPADFANDINVEAMSTLQVGAYLLLLCKAWQAEPPASLPNDDAVLARFARVELATWQEIKAGVLAAFRVGTDGRLHSKRLRLEYDKALQLMRTKSKAGAAGANARWQTHGRRMADAMPPQCDSNANQNQNQNQKEERRSTPTAVSPPPPPSWGNGEHILFAEFWKAYPRKARRPEAAKAFLDLNPDCQLLHAMLAAVEAQSHSPQWVEKSGEFIPFPAKWLRERGWEDLPPEKLRPATTNVIYDTL